MTNRSSLRLKLSLRSLRNKSNRLKRKTSVKEAMNLESGWGSLMKPTSATKMMIWKRTTYLRGSLEKTLTPLARAHKRRQRLEQLPQIPQTSLTKTAPHPREHNPSSQSPPPLALPLLPPSPPSKWTWPTGFPQPPRLQSPPKTLLARKEYYKASRKSQCKKTKNRVLNNPMFLNLMQGNDWL